MLNDTAIMGRLTADPELRHTQSGTAVCSFTLAVERDGDTGRLDKNQRPEYDPRLAQRTFQEAIRRRGNRRTTTTAESDQ